MIHGENPQKGGKVVCIPRKDSHFGKDKERAGSIGPAANRMRILAKVRSLKEITEEKQEPRCHCWDIMFRQRDEIRKWLFEVIEKFRQMGAISPERATTAQELGLPPGFQEAMKRRLGRSGIFVEVNGKYYLSEERLKQMEELGQAERAAWSSRKKILTLRIVQMVTVALFATLMLANMFFQSWEVRVISSLFLVLWLVVCILQIYYLSRARRTISWFK